MNKLFPHFRQLFVSGFVDISPKVQKSSQKCDNKMGFATSLLVGIVYIGLSRGNSHIEPNLFSNLNILPQLYPIFFFHVSQMCSVAKSVASNFAINGKNLHNS
jgi:hypothetical protein